MFTRRSLQAAKQLQIGGVLECAGTWTQPLDFHAPTRVMAPIIDHYKDYAPNMDYNYKEVQIFHV